MIMSEKARQKLLAHARQVLFYQGLAREERVFMIDMLRKKMLSDIAVDREVEQTLETVETFLNVDPIGGIRKAVFYRSGSL